VTKITPVGTTKDLQMLVHVQWLQGLATYHVQVQESNPETEVILIEYSLKLMVQKSSTLSEPNPSPGIKRSTLEFNQRVGSRRALSHVRLIPPSGQFTGWPSRRVGTVKPEGVAIMTVDINRSLASARCIVATSPGIIANQRHDDTSIACLVLDILHVDCIWEAIVSTAGTAVLIFGLIENDRTAFCDLAFGNCCSDIGDVARQKLISQCHL
jgi:hypothetical protein